MDIDIDLIRPSPFQPRQVFNLDDLKMEIQRDGLLSDLVVRKRGEFFELIDGERRSRALKELGWKTVPVRMIEVDDTVARRSVYKLNKVRENYTLEEEARYFKRLSDEGMTPWEISKELNVDFHWVLAHLNVFKFPEEIQKAVWIGQISLSHMVALESVIGRNIDEALAVVNEVLRRRLTLAETRKIVREREEKVMEMRLEAAKEVLPEVAPEAAELKTPEDFEKAAKALKKIAKKKREEVLTPAEKALRESLKKMKLEKLQRKKEEVVESLEKVEVEGEEKKESVEGLLQSLRDLRERIEALESEKLSLLKIKVSFNCPHCSRPCILYRDEERFWVKQLPAKAIVT
jgi:ParB family chromosome partitioning protein